MRKISDAIAMSGKMRKTISASCQSSSRRITIEPRSVSVAWISVTIVSVTSEFSASTSFVMRLISTPAGRRS